MDENIYKKKKWNEESKPHHTAYRVHTFNGYNATQIDFSILVIINYHKDVCRLSVLMLDQVIRYSKMRRVDKYAPNVNSICECDARDKLAFKTWKWKKKKILMISWMIKCSTYSMQWMQSRLD